MKKVILISVAFVAILMSCNNKAKVNSEIPAAPPVPVTETLGNKCYASLDNKDTISMQLNINVNNEVNGKLTYITYHKDKNEGTIVGNIKGDTLIADYTFTSPEGKSSIREVVFLKKDSRYIEGYGAVLKSNEKTVFIDKTKLKFNGKIFNEVDCKE